MDVLIHVMWIALIVVAIIFALSGLDESLFDIIYWIRFFYRKYKMRRFKPLDYEDLVKVPEQKIAILVPCWHESNVIYTMLKHNVGLMDYENYDIFVGVYPNDPETIAKVKLAEKDLPHVICALGKQRGPTTKAENLNSIYDFIEKYEKRKKIKYEIFVLHDSEDVIHPLSLKLYNYLIPRKNMIQIPVFPLEVGALRFTHWIYNDEFAENHTKDIIVRETIRGLVPSAGVGTAISRDTIQLLKEENNGQPFSTHTFTEDYDTALRIKNLNLKEIFVSQIVKKTVYKKRWKYFGKYVPKVVKEYIATRSLFPTQYFKAIKQRSRWVVGITMQEWANIGWQGDFFTRYTLFHDRKSVITHFINFFGYVVFLFWLFYSFWQLYNPNYPSLQEFFNAHRWVWWLIVLCTILMIDRLLQRMIAVYRIYGILPALLSLPRAIYGNFLNMHALIRAYWQYFVGLKIAKNSKWDKTEHTFPTESELKPFKKRLGHLLLENKLITKKQLDAAISTQLTTGERLGKVLTDAGYVTQNQLLAALSKQFNMKIITLKENNILARKKLPLLLATNYHWMIRHHAYPVKLSKHNLTIAIEDPTNEGLIEQIKQHAHPYHIDFVLYAHEKNGG